MSAVNCTEPPERPPSGTWEWAGSQEYLAEADYTCGLYGMFQVQCWSVNHKQCSKYASESGYRGEVRGADLGVRLEPKLGALRTGPVRGHLLSVHPLPPATPQHEIRAG